MKYFMDEKKKSCEHINQMDHDSACDVLQWYMLTSWIFNQSWHFVLPNHPQLTMESLSQFEF